MKIRINSPVTITFTFICVIVFLLKLWVYSDINTYLSLKPSLDWNLFNYFTYIFAHYNTEHILGNLSIILILAPLIEEKYGSKSLIILILITAIITALINKIFFTSGLIGASGIAFMLIILSSFTGSNRREIPLTFILVFALYVGKEIINSFDDDKVSQFAHIAGGICGSIAGFSLNRRKLS